MTGDLLRNPYLVFACSAVIGLILIAGGVGKLINLRAFAKLLLAYDILPKKTLPIAGLMLPIAELGTGIMVLLQMLRPLADYLAAALLLAFVLALATNLVRGRRDLPCGCFGRGAKGISWRLVFRNLAFVGLALLSAGGYHLLPILLFSLYGISLLIHHMDRPRGDSIQASG